MKVALVISLGFALFAPLAPSADKPIEETWFEFIDGTGARAEYIDLNLKTHDRLFIRYGPMSDSGVELERVIDGKVLWRKHVEPLGVEHSKYRHEVHVSIDRLTPDTIRVTSIGKSIIYEARALSDGRKISREIKPVTK